MVWRATQDAVQKDQKEAKGTRTIKLTERFICKRSDIYDAYTHPHRIMAFSQSRAESDPTPGGKFLMFDGNVLGKLPAIPKKHRFHRACRCKCPRPQ